MPSSLISGVSVSYDDSRIKNHPDKKLLENIRAYYKPFTDGDADGQRKFHTHDFNMTDIPLGVVRASRDKWHDLNKGFSHLLTDGSVVALSLHGSSAPGSFSIMEHVTYFSLAADPPPEAAQHLPPGAKGGDRLSLIDIDVVWWNEHGHVTRELVYGRLTWKDFNIGEFDEAK